MKKNFWKSDIKKAMTWSEKNYNDLPWREKRSFYGTLVSEIMLQQTTVTTVKNRFENFMRKYPSLSALSHASDEDLLRLWQGLGYYSRAIRLKEAAKVLSNNSENCTVEYLKTINGIGDYTANALVAIGFNKAALAIDVNLERVLVRYFGLDLSKIKIAPREFIKKYVSEKIGKNFNHYRSFHEAMMDVGRVFCQQRQKNCLICPLKAGCNTFNSNADLYLINKVKKTKKIQEIQIYRVVLLHEGRIYLKQRAKGQWLAGQWEVPSIVLQGKINAKQYDLMENVFFAKIHHEFKTTITHHKFINKVVVFKILKKAPREIFNRNIQDSIFKGQGVWVKTSEVSKMPLTSVMHKILEQM